MISPFDVMKEMSKRNSQNIVMFDEHNIESVSERKDGWGYVKIAVANSWAARLLGSLMGKPTTRAFMLMFDIEEYNSIKEEMENEE